MCHACEFDGHTARSPQFPSHEDAVVLANTSQNTACPTITSQLDIRLPLTPPPEGKGVEAGVQHTLLRRLLFGPNTFYETEQINVTSGMAEQRLRPSYNYNPAGLRPYYTAAQLANIPICAEQQRHCRPSTRNPLHREPAVLNLSRKFLCSRTTLHGPARTTPTRALPLFNQLKQFVASSTRPTRMAAGPAARVRFLPTPNPSQQATPTLWRRAVFLLEDLDVRALDFTQASAPESTRLVSPACNNFAGDRLREVVPIAAARVTKVRMLSATNPRPATVQRQTTPSLRRKLTLRHGVSRSSGKNTRFELQLTPKLLDNQTSVSANNGQRQRVCPLEFPDPSARSSCLLRFKL